MFSGKINLYRSKYIIQSRRSQKGLGQKFKISSGDLFFSRGRSFLGDTLPGMEVEHFCDELREKTQIAHDQSDKKINLKLAVVLTDVKTWAKSVAEFYFVFQTLEQCLKTHSSHVHLGQLINPHLLRTGRFEEDLSFYLGENWRSQISMSEEAQTYCNHLLRLSEKEPTLLLA